MKKDATEYAKFVDNLIKKYDGSELNFLHGAIGVSKEAGELLDNAYRHWNYKKPVDVKNVLEEAGDILFYLQATLNLFDLDLSDAVMDNIIKLRKRFPSGYNDTSALARADKEGGT